MYKNFLFICSTSHPALILLHFSYLIPNVFPYEENPLQPACTLVLHNLVAVAAAMTAAAAAVVVVIAVVV
jgi:hypothetical protein